MRTVGMMRVDLARSAAGLASNQSADLAGRPVLARAVARALSAERIDRLALLAPKAQLDAVGQLLGPLAGDDRLIVHPLPPDARPFLGALDPARVRLARRWAMSCWRGGLGGATWFDELFEPVAMAELAAELQPDAVALLSPEAAVADAALIDGIIAQHAANRDDYHLAFSQAPVGLGAVVLRGELLAQFVRARQPIGWSLAYDPSTPHGDHVATDAVFRLPVEVVACPHRLLADTRRGLRLLARVIEQLGDAPSAAETTTLVNEIFAAEPQPWPMELDFELTNERAVDDVLRPSRPLVPARGPASPEVVARLCQAVADSGIDDLLVTLGGFGDALLHPDALEVAGRLKQAGALAVAIRTSGASLDDALVDRLLAGDAVDVLVVELDAFGEELYRRLKGAGGLERIVARLHRLRELRDKAGRPGPMIVAEMIKCPATLDELEPFFDHWRFGDEANLAGLNAYAGQFDSPAGPPWSMAAPRRRPCVRIGRRLTVLADGQVVQCDQDFAAVAPLAPLGPLGSIWQGQPLARLRDAHRRGDLSDVPLCAACDEWHRP